MPCRHSCEKSREKQRSGQGIRSCGLTAALTIFRRVTERNPIGANAEYRDIPVKSVLLPSLCRWHEKDRMLGLEYVISWNGKPVRNMHGAWRRALKKQASQG